MELIDNMFNGLKDYLNTKSIYSPLLVQRADSDDYPKVVFMWEMGANNYNGHLSRNIMESYIINLDIYAKDEDNASAIDIAEELEKLIYDYMVIFNNFKISFASPTPNIDESIYRISMRFMFYGKNL